MTGDKDYYAVLDINPVADRRAIAEAYERLASKYQPDDNAPPVDPERMREVDEAFDVLDDPERRAQYDRLRGRPIAADEPPAEPGTGWAPVAAAAATPGRRLDWVVPAVLALSGFAFVAAAAGLLLVALAGDADRTVTLASGLRYTETTKGSGDPAHPGDALTAHFTGRLEDGTEFGSSLGGNPFVFVLGAREVIPGWDEGFGTMREGGKRTLIIPPDLGYGPEGIPNGPIPPNATLVFEVELLDIEAIGQEIETESGLRQADLEPGRDQSGQAILPEEGDEVVVHYTGVLADGTRFVDTPSQGSPYTFVLGSGSEIRGFDEGIGTMKVGGLRRLVIPPELGYGDKPQEFTIGDKVVTIEANSTLIFDVRLLGIQEPTPEGQ